MTARAAYRESAALPVTKSTVLAQRRYYRAYAAWLIFREFAL